MLGISGAQKLRGRKELLLDWKQLMQRFKTEISYSAFLLPELIVRNQESAFCRLAFREETFEQEPVLALWGAGKRLLKNKEDAELFGNFVQGLGISDVQGQMEHISLYSQLLDQRLEGASRDLLSKPKLYLSLGLFSSLALCIVLL